jgi:hypothetical protein
MLSSSWPDLHQPGWGATRETLHMWTQVVGKVKLALCPFLNQWWEVAFALTARGLSTGLVPAGDRSFEAVFDVVDHVLRIDVTDGRGVQIPLRPRPVAEFHGDVMSALADFGIQAAPSPGPSEVPDPVPFAEQTGPGAYDPDAVRAWWRAMIATVRVMQRFRTPFHGKSSPVNFFWGGFDLNHSRFNGERNPKADPTAGPIMRFGENEANLAVGFWPGNGPHPHAGFYAYLSPAPDGVADLPVEHGSWSAEMGEFVLPYDQLRLEDDPDAALLAFFTSVYEGSADLAGWDRQALEGDVPVGFAP